MTEACCGGTTQKFCRHATEAQKISQLIDVFELEWIRQDDGLARYKELLRLRDGETKAMLSHGRALRINQHTLLKAETARSQSGRVNTGKPMPWDAEGWGGGNPHGEHSVDLRPLLIFTTAFDRLLQLE